MGYPRRVLFAAVRLIELAWAERGRYTHTHTHTYPPAQQASKNTMMNVLRACVWHHLVCMGRSRAPQHVMRRACGWPGLCEGVVRHSIEDGWAPWGVSAHVLSGLGTTGELQSALLAVAQQALFYACHE